MYCRFIVLIALFSWLAGCAPLLTVSTQRDMTYRLNKEMPIFLELGSDISISEKNLHNYIEQSLRQAGFSVVSQLADSKVVMTFGVADEQQVYREFDPWPYYFGRSRYYRPWPRYYSRTYVQEQRSIKLRLFDAEIFKQGRRRPLWEGVVSGDRATLEDNLQTSLEVLIGKVGEDFKGRIKLQ